MSCTNLSFTSIYLYLDFVKLTELAFSQILSETEVDSDVSH